MTVNSYPWNLNNMDTTNKTFIVRIPTANVEERWEKFHKTHPQIKFLKKINQWLLSKNKFSTGMSSIVMNPKHTYIWAYMLYMYMFCVCIHIYIRIINKGEVMNSWETRENTGWVAERKWAGGNDVQYSCMNF